MGYFTPLGPNIFLALGFHTLHYVLPSQKETKLQKHAKQLEILLYIPLQLL